MRPECTARARAERRAVRQADQAQGGLLRLLPSQVQLVQCIHYCIPHACTSDGCGLAREHVGTLSRVRKSRTARGQNLGHAPLTAVTAVIVAVAASHRNRMLCSVQCVPRSPRHTRRKFARRLSTLL